MIGFLQHKGISYQNQPVQLVDRVIYLFKKFLDRPKSRLQEKFNLESLISSKYKVLTEADSERLILKESAKATPTNESSVLN